MDRDDLHALLREVQTGHTTPAEAALRLDPLATADLGFARLDLGRPRRTGEPEVVYGETKSAEQVAALMARIYEAGQVALATRISREKAAAVSAAFPAGLPTPTWTPMGRLLSLTPADHTPAELGHVAVVCAGTSDLPVAEEAAETAAAFGSHVRRHTDIGVAGLQRLLGALPALREARVIVAVAGMEGALPTVLAGLVEVPVVAVPTSVGYGGHLGGITPMLGMLTACAPGISVVNIDNGFGAGVVAHRINRLGAP